MFMCLFFGIIIVGCRILWRLNFFFVLNVKVKRFFVNRIFLMWFLFLLIMGKWEWVDLSIIGKNFFIFCFILMVVIWVWGIMIFFICILFILIIFLIILWVCGFMILFCLVLVIIDINFFLFFGLLEIEFFSLFN